MATGRNDVRAAARATNESGAGELRAEATHRAGRYIVKPDARGALCWSQPDGEYEADVRVRVDVAKLLRMIGAKAVRSKGGRTVLQGGAVIVERIGPARLIGATVSEEQARANHAEKLRTDKALWEGKQVEKHPACPMCEGSGYTVDGARESKTCAACDGTGRGVRCLCGEEIVPAGSRVTHEEGDEGSGDGEAVHTPERCARYTPRDGWETWQTAEQVEDVTHHAGWVLTLDGRPEWCEQFTTGRQS